MKKTYKLVIDVDMLFFHWKYHNILWNIVFKCLIKRQQLSLSLLSLLHNQEHPFRTRDIFIWEEMNVFPTSTESIKPRRLWGYNSIACQSFILSWERACEIPFFSQCNYHFIFCITYETKAKADCSFSTFNSKFYFPYKALSLLGWLNVNFTFFNNLSAIWINLQDPFFVDDIFEVLLLLMNGYFIFALRLSLNLSAMVNKLQEQFFPRSHFLFFLIL